MRKDSQEQKREDKEMRGRKEQNTAFFSDSVP
jgi:hypothetical protein